VVDPTESEDVRVVVQAPQSTLRIGLDTSELAEDAQSQCGKGADGSYR
jgi:hypothetical protein